MRVVRRYVQQLALAQLDASRGATADEADGVDEGVRLDGATVRRRDASSDRGTHALEVAERDLRLTMGELRLTTEDLRSPTGDPRLLTGDLQFTTGDLR